MLLRRFQRQHEQLSQFEKRRIIAMMEAGWSGAVHTQGNWTAEEYNKVIFSGESRFNLSSADNSVRVWRPRGKRLNPAFALQRHTAPTAGNARSYTARVSQDSLHTVTTLPWPDRSSDLSPIEHIWDRLGQRVGHPTSLNELEARLLQIWKEISQDMTQNTYVSMPDRSSSCIRSSGGSTGEAGWSNRRIGRHLGRSDMVVARCFQQWITEGRVYRHGGSGRPRNTNDREDRAIRRVATSAPTTSLALIQRHLPPSRHPVPSRETIRRRLTEVGLRSRRPLRRLPLTPHHRQCRLDFLPTSGNLSVTDWRRVVFSDESRFSLSADDHRTRVWRRSGQRSDPAFIVERHTAISQGVTVWGAISWDTRSSLVVLQGTLTARRYVDDILTPIVLPMLSNRPGAIYQQDNARPHTARLSQQCLQGYDVLPWPARSPDLSPIEHVCDALGR
ncbi:HTH_Tnp_Tc3_2 domain-containing protein [Trichonephila clavipes]|nr:HTH_Tnp_Tc3_2 domain-containing protein [Trichonephila clavipes]